MERDRTTYTYTRDKSSSALCYNARGLLLVNQIGGAPPGRAESYESSLPRGRTVGPLLVLWWPLLFKWDLQTWYHKAHPIKFPSSCENVLTIVVRNLTRVAVTLMPQHTLISFPGHTTFVVRTSIHITDDTNRNPLPLTQNVDVWIMHELGLTTR